MGSDKHERRAQKGKGLPYTQLFHWIRQTPAWRSLGPYARLLYIELRARYNGINNGNIPMSYREAEELLGCSNKPIPGAFRELQERGFIKPNRKGAFSWKVRFEGTGRATTWILTELRQDFPAEVLIPTCEFKQWTAHGNKSRHAESGSYARPERAIDDGMARQKRANGTPKAGHLGKKQPPDGTLKAGTSISTISPMAVGQPTAALLRTLKQKRWTGKTGGSANRKSGGGV